jgi:hypothetical protein
MLRRNKKVGADLATMLTSRPIQPRNPCSYGIIDAAIRIAVPPAAADLDEFMQTLGRLGYAGATLFSETEDQRTQNTMFDALVPLLNELMTFVPMLDVARGGLMQQQDDWNRRGLRAFSLSTIGSFRSPLRRVEPETIESFTAWEHACERQFLLFAEPTLSDAALLVNLCAHFPDVPVVVRGNLITGHARALSTFIRQMPSPDRFTFDRLHQLPAVSLLLSPSEARRVSTYPPGPPVGWHSFGNLLALFGSGRICWGSELDLADFLTRTPSYSPDLFDYLDADQIEAVLGRNIRLLFA